MSGMLTMTKSMSEMIAISASKMLKESRAYSLKPKPISLMIISATKNQITIALICSAISLRSKFIGY